MIEELTPAKAIMDDLTCDYFFFRQYQLPCEHIWHHELQYHLMTDLHWDIYARMFDDCGMEVYESTKEIWVDREISLDIQDERKRKLRACEITETLMSQYYDAENACKDAELGRDSTDLVINYWLTELASSTG